MLSETIIDGLDQYRIGEKVRALRTGKKLGLVQLGEYTGLSAAMLSKIERGQLYPTLPTLLRIALVFGVGLQHFFVADDAKTAAVVRKADRVRLPDRPGAAEPSYFFESLDYPVNNREMEAYFAEFPRGAKPSAQHNHQGMELIYVVSGELSVNLGGDEIILARGDAVHFDASVAHSYGSRGRSAATAIVVVTGGVKQGQA